MLRADMGRLSNMMPSPRILTVTLLAIVSLLSMCVAQEASERTASFNVQDLFGIWAVGGDGRRPSSRSFEFLPDGTVFDTQQFSSSGGGGKTTERRRRSWILQQDKVVISDTNTSGQSGNPVVEISIPFDKNRLELREVSTSADSTRTTTMFATMAAPSSAPPHGNTPAADSSTPVKLQLTVSPSVKTTTDGYYKVQKMSLVVTLKNSDLKNATGPLTVSYWILGKTTNDAKQFCLLKNGSFTCSLGFELSSRELKKVTEPVANRFYAYSYGSSSYSEYEGWLVVVKNSANQVIAVKSNKPEWEHQFEKASRLQRGDVYNFHLDKMDGMHVYYEGS